MILQCQRGTDELNHGVFRFVVNNVSWRVTVPDEIGHFFLEDGRAGVFQVADPEPGASVCPCCGFAWKPEKE